MARTVCRVRQKEVTGWTTSPVGKYVWDRIAMDILDVCDSTPDGYRYIFVIADYFSKWTEAFPIKNKCADTVVGILVEKIILRFGMPWRSLMITFGNHYIGQRPAEYGYMTLKQ